MITVPLSWPRCARCNRKVDRFEAAGYSPADRGYVYRAHCHGKSEETILTDYLLQQGPVKISAGTAFKVGQ